MMIMHMITMIMHMMIIDDTAVDNHNDDAAAADNDKVVSGNVRNYVLLTYIIAFVPLKSS